MSEPSLDKDLVAFVRSSIPSVWTLELLLLLCADGGTRAWSVDGLTRESRSSRPLVTDVLSTLHRAGLVVEEADGQFRYRPANAELDRLVARLARAYAETPFAVRTEVSHAPNAKIQGFADAFRLKKE